MAKELVFKLSGKDYNAIRYDTAHRRVTKTSSGGGLDE